MKTQPNPLCNQFPPSLRLPGLPTVSGVTVHRRVHAGGPISFSTFFADDSLTILLNSELDSGKTATGTCFYGAARQPVTHNGKTISAGLAGSNAGITTYYPATQDGTQQCVRAGVGDRESGATGAVVADNRRALEIGRTGPDEFGRSGFPEEASGPASHSVSRHPVRRHRRVCITVREAPATACGRSLRADAPVPLFRVFASFPRSGVTEETKRVLSLALSSRLPRRGTSGGLLLNAILLAVRRCTFHTFH